MTLDMEVRSSGAGPRHRWHGSTRNWHFRWVWTASRIVAGWWDHGPHKHGARECSKMDGIAIIIRVVD